MLAAATLFVASHPLFSSFTTTGASLEPFSKELFRALSREEIHLKRKVSLTKERAGYGACTMVFTGVARTKELLDLTLRTMR